MKKPQLGCGTPLEPRTSQADRQDGQRPPVTAARLSMTETEHGRMPEREPVREPHQWTLGCRRMSPDSGPRSGSRSSREMG